MPRGPLSDDQKAKMQSARKTTAQDREAAFSALESNAQFTNPTFWARVSTECQDAVLEAIRKAQRSEKKAEIERLRATLAELEAEV
jgi:TRAP-type C4-dicarboxylate transport system substrate-binding protein